MSQPPIEPGRSTSETIDPDLDAAARRLASNLVAAHLAASDASVRAILSNDGVGADLDLHEPYAANAVDSCRKVEGPLRQSALVTALAFDLRNAEPRLHALDLAHASRILEVAIDTLYTDLCNVPRKGDWDRERRARFLAGRFFGGLRHARESISNDPLLDRLVRQIDQLSPRSDSLVLALDKVAIAARGIIAGVRSAENGRRAIVMGGHDVATIAGEPTSRRRVSNVSTGRASDGQALGVAKGQVDFYRRSVLHDAQSDLLAIAELPSGEVPDYFVDVLRRTIETIVAFEPALTTDRYGRTAPLTDSLVPMEQVLHQVTEARWAALSPLLRDAEQAARIATTTIVRPTVEPEGEAPVRRANRSRWSGRSLH